MRARYIAWRKTFDSLIATIDGAFDSLEATLTSIEPKYARTQFISTAHTRELASWTASEGHITSARRDARHWLRGVHRRGFDFYVVLTPTYIDRCVGLIDRLTDALAKAGVEPAAAPTLHFGDPVPCTPGVHEWSLDTVGLSIPLRAGQFEARALLELRVQAASDRFSLEPAALVSVCYGDGAVRTALRERAREAINSVAFPLSAGIGKVSLPGQEGNGSVFGEEVSGGLALLLKDQKGRRPHRDVSVPKPLPKADALVRLFIPQLTEQIQRAIGQVAAENAGDYRYVTAGLRGTPEIDVAGRAIKFRAYFNLLQQGGTNPLEWEYWVNTELGLTASLSPRGVNGFGVTTTVTSDKVESFGGRWRQGGGLFSIQVDDQRVLGFVGATKTGMHGRRFESNLKLTNLSVRDVAYFPDSVFLVADLLSCSAGAS